MCLKVKDAMTKLWVAKDRRIRKCAMQQNKCCIAAQAGKRKIEHEHPTSLPWINSQRGTRYDPL